MEHFDINRYVAQQTSKVFAAKWIVENGKYDFYPGLIPHTKILTGIETLKEIEGIYQ